MNIAAPLLKEKFVEQLTMMDLIDKEACAEMFPKTIHITDVTLTMCNCPKGNHEEVK